MNRRDFLGGCLGCYLSFALTGCTSTPVTNRKQLSIYPDSVINRQASLMYKRMIQRSKLSDDKDQLKTIIDIGEKQVEAIDHFFKKLKKPNPVANYKWEYNLIDNKMANAFCFPGGKIGIFTGILPYTANKDGLASVMGHEIAHAVARHSAERMSRAIAVTLGTGIADAVTGGAVSRTRDAIGQITGVDVVDSTLMRPHGRSQESEADYMGLIFASLSGYDINESVRVWKRMNKKFGKKEFPEFLSTHPSTKTRILDLRGLIPEVRKKYPPLNI